MNTNWPLHIKLTRNYVQMAQTIYRNVWESKEIRTLILGILMISICSLLELIFIFFQFELENSVLAFLFTEIELLDGTFTPFLILFHLIIWGILVFCTLVVYAVVREYAGGRMGVLEIIGIILIYAITAFLLFDIWFALYFVGLSALIIGYMYVALVE
jgi:hypothetical protein